MTSSPASSPKEKRLRSLSSGERFRVRSKRRND